MIICANLWTKKRSGKESRDLAKQAVITKCRDNINAEPAVPLKKPCSSVPKIKICDNYNKVIKKSVLICDNLWTKRTQTTDGFFRPQINTDYHRLRAKGSDY